MTCYQSDSVVGGTLCDCDVAQSQCFKLFFLNLQSDRKIIDTNNPKIVEYQPDIRPGPIISQPLVIDIQENKTILLYVSFIFSSVCQVHSSQIHVVAYKVQHTSPVHCI